MAPRRPSLLPCLGAVLLLLLPSCRGPDNSPPSPRNPGPLRIVVSIPPLAWLVHELAPASALITQLVPVGVGCEGVELTPLQVLAIDQADLIVITGLGLEPQFDRALRLSPRPNRRIATFLTALPATDSLLHATTPHDHDSHSEHDDHGHSGFDPHAWLDPDLMVSLARHVHAQIDAALNEIEPDPEALVVQRNQTAASLARIESSCRDIDAEYRAALSTLASRSFVTEHNAYAYLARRYNLSVAAVIRPIHEVEPAPADIEAAARAITDHAASVIFVDPHYSRAGADRIASLTGARVLTLDSLGDGDWPALMRANLHALLDGLGGASK